MSGALTPAHVRARIEAVRRRHPGAGVVIGIHAMRPWTGPARLRTERGEVEVAACRSALEFREKLDGRASDAPPLVLITALSDADLGDDVLARLARRRLVTVDAWDILREMFQARLIDPRLAKHPWMADALVEHVTDTGYPPAKGGVLSLETAWGALLSSWLAMAEPRPDATALLRWTMVREHLERYAASPARLRDALPDWLEESAGPVAGALLTCVDLGNGSDVLPIGLVCGVLYGAEADGDVTLAMARVRLETYTGKGIETPVFQRWAAVAESIMLADFETRGIEAVRPWLRRAQEILAEVEAGALAWRSRVLLSGLEQCLARFGSALLAALESDAPASMTALEEAARAVREHALAPAQRERVERVEMSRRLYRWLAAARTGADSFAAAAAAYVREGAFVDWARGRLRGGDASEELSAACERLLQAVLERREAENRDFARHLRGWLEAGSGGDDLLPVEDVLARVVAPLAATAPVLLLVLDGLSHAISAELIEDLSLRGRVMLRPREETPAGLSSAPGVAVLPSVTEVSRASLLCGALRQGAQAVEREGFAQHPALVAASRARFPPVLFHKGDLSDASATDLSESVRAALASTEQRVVGIVLNAVDDYLLKSDQVRPVWKGDYLKFLEPILDAAEEAGRVVVLTSDHGHVLDLHTELRKGGQSDRWRADDGRCEDGEVMLNGRRVLSAAGARITALWSERARFGPKRNGYHGGASPQEVLVSLAVLASPTLHLDGWEETTLRYPGWWQEVTPAAPAPVIEAVRARPRTQVPAKGQGRLFETPRPEAPRPSPPWIDALLSSEIYRAQKAAAGRIATPDDRVRTFLLALDERGGKLTQQALAQRLGLSPVRVRGTVAAVRRVLNVEGYEVLSLDEESDTVGLNLELLKVQFELS